MKRQLSSMLKFLLVFIVLTGMRSHLFAVTDSSSTDSVDLWHSDFSQSSISTAPGGTVLLFSQLRVSNSNYVISGSTGYYLSQDSILDRSIDSFSVGDILLGKTYYFMASGQTSYLDSFSVFSFPDVPVGQYYIICSTDDGNEIAETDEINNLNFIPVTVGISYKDLYISNLSINPTQAANKQAFIGYTLNNGGSVGAYNFRDSYFISNDTILDSLDINMGSAYMAVGANIPTPMQYTFTVPNLPNGQYYFFINTDYFNDIEESDELNNTQFIPFVVTDPYIDLVAKEIAPLVSPVAVGDKDVLVMFSENNIGTHEAAMHTNNVYLSQDSIYDSSDILIGQNTIYYYLPNQNYIINNYVNIPDSITAGFYYFIHQSDANNEINESDETNNTSFASIEIVVPDLDLTITARDTFANAFVGQYFIAKFNLENKGTTYANPHFLNYYLSQDTLLDSSDTFLSSRSVYKMNPDTSLYADLYYTFNLSAIGDYYVLCIADPANSVNETNELNNSAYLKISVQNPTYDVVINAISLNNTELHPGSRVWTNYTVVNIGTAPIQDYVLVNGYWSKDTVFSSDDVFAYGEYLYFYVDTINRTVEIPVPFNTDSSFKYLLLVADPYNSINEINEANNSSAVSVNIHNIDIDLELKEVNLASTTISAGSTLTGTLKIKNNGTTPLNNTYVQINYFISQDTVINYAEEFAGIASFESIGANDSNLVNLSALLPAWITGDYYLITELDYFNGINETNEGNNTNHQLIHITAPDVDLKIRSVSLSNTAVYPGSSVTVSSYLKNRGTQASYYTRTAYYLSQDTVFDYHDYQLGDYSIEPVAGKDSVFQNVVLYLPYMPAGDYYLFIVADVYDSQLETNETNNIAYRKIRFKDNIVDLDIKAAKLSSKNVHGGDIITARHTVVNKSTSQVYNGYTEYFISLDSIRSYDDYTLFSTSYIYDLLPSSEKADSVDIYIPTGITPGTYYFIYHVDAYDWYYEQNESNNYAYKVINILPGSSSKELSDKLEAAGEFSVSVVPNPVQETINVVIANYADKKVAFKLFDIIGNEVYTNSAVISNGKFSIDASNLNAGVYLLQVESEGKVETIRVIKQ